MTHPPEQRTLFAPPRAQVTYADRQPVYTCPHCGTAAALDACDCFGADEDCLFCPHCGGEFHQ